ncbi:MAG: hypothetical protein WBN96_15230, partial [Gammaproteobacteria bacterium]
YEEVKAALLLAGAELRIPIPVMTNVIEQNSRIRRMVRQMVKAMRHLSELYTVAGVHKPEAKEPVTNSPELVEALDEQAITELDK